MAVIAATLGTLPLGSIGPVGPAAAQSASSTVFGTGFDRGDVDATVHGLKVSEEPGPKVRWQSAVVRTGTGAYHFVGGVVRADATIHNNTKALPLGDLETWSGGAFRFVSFPTEEPSWLLVTAPTDGRAGAETKPVVSIEPSGRLILSGGGRTGPAARSAPLHKDRWYYLMLHGRNGVAQQQELYVYDGRDGELLERIQVTLDVTGEYRNRITKWGFGTVGDFTGLEYYLDDIFYAPGSANPGPVRIVTAGPVGTVGSGRFQPVGAPTPHEALGEVPPDRDTTYVANPSGEEPDELELRVANAGLGAGDAVHAVQTVVQARAIDAHATPSIGIRAGSVTAVAPATLAAGYTPKRVVHATDPRTGAPWTPSSLGDVRGVIRDDDSIDARWRASTAWWEVIVRQGGEAPAPTPSPSPDPKPSPSPTSPSPSPTPSASPSAPPGPIPLPIPLPLPLPLPFPLPLPIPLIGDTEAPTVDVTRPADGGTERANATVTIAVSASDNVGIEEVEILVDGAPLCTDAQAPYDCPWRVPRTAGVRHRIEARAVDAAGNAAADHAYVTTRAK